MSLTFHIRVAHFFPMPKRTSIFKNHLCLLSHTHTHKHTHIFIYIHRYIHTYIQTQIFRVYLIWRPKLNVSKVGMLLSKNTPNGPKIPHLLFFFFFLNETSVLVFAKFQIFDSI